MKNTVVIGREAPDFTATAVMPDNKIESDFNLKSYVKGGKCILFFYPLDFTFVCPSEIISFHNRIGDFAERFTKIVGVSVDSHFSHLAWKNMPYNKGGIGNVQLTLVSDMNKIISQSYNVLTEGGIALRGTFFIDQDFIVRSIGVNDLGVGRNVDELIRIIDAFDHMRKHGEVCPAGWHKGEEAMFPTAEGVSDYLASHAHKL